jgi:cardiolipin-specific phospholipase
MSSQETLSQPEEEVRPLNQQSKEPYVVRQNPSASSGWFPLSYKEGFSQWVSRETASAIEVYHTNADDRVCRQWSKIPAAAAEHKVLSFIPYLQQAPTQRQTGNRAESPDATDGAPDSLQSVDHSQQGDETTNSVNDPYGPRRWRSRMVELSGKDRALNEFSVERVGENAEQNLVILHGYGIGLGIFYKNFEPLSRAKGWHLYALDMLGMGRSTRPPFRIKAKNRQDAVTEAEDWFVDALEEWRVKRKIDRFTLMGHSLGGYMAVAYALKYPGHLNKLILASPVGIPENPYAADDELPQPSESSLVNEFTQDQEEITADATQKDNSSTLMNLRTKASEGGLAAAATAAIAATASTPSRRQLPKWFSYLWDANISPFSLVRWSGPLGPRLVSGWTHRRFSHLPDAEFQALHQYSYSIFRLRGSGEYALAYILAPGAYARSPLIRRIHGVGRQIIRPSSAEAVTPEGTSAATSAASDSPDSASSSSASTKQENGIPIVFMYGDHDWMDVQGGYAAKEKIEEERRNLLRDASPEEREADNGSAKVVIIKKAGHNLFLDSYEEFNKVVLEEMEDVRRREERRKNRMEG